jgi:UDP-N-acetylmuramate: L-alanyl-gamma-D-glutamyl-meso-diaminopimelate ligase
MNKERHIHIIGICGVATSALAIAFHKNGWKVTGSDKGFYPPVSTHLTEAGILYYAGWHPENIGSPDLVVAGAGGTALSNPEIMYVKEKGLPLLSFAEALGKYFVKKNSIVVTGTWGKTTISAMLSYILLEAGMDPSYFTGAVSLSHETGALGNSDWSVVEGDEYQAAIWDRKAKFFYYKPTHLLLTSVSWDHADLYPTEEAYFDAFRKIVAEIPDSGLIVACADEKGIVKVLGNKKAVTYGKKSADFIYHSISHTLQGLSFGIRYDDEEYKIESPMLGRFNVENITGAFAMAYSIGIPAEKIIAALKKFKGIKRRLEKRYEGEVTIFDCHGPTAEKAASNLESLREVYSGKIIAVYEPNTGSRQHANAYMYDDAFKNADSVIIPRLTKIKVDAGASEKAFEGKELAEVISKTHPHCRYIESDEELVATLRKEAEKSCVIAFIGSHGFRGMIEETIQAFQA